MSLCDSYASSPNSFLILERTCRALEASPLVHFFRHSVVINGISMVLVTAGYHLARGLWRWLSQPSNLSLTVTAAFTQGDPAYDWLVMYLTDRGIWRHESESVISARRGEHRVGPAVFSKLHFPLNDAMDFIPADGYKERFWWRGYLAEVAVSQDGSYWASPDDRPPPSLRLRLFTRNVSALERLVEEVYQASVSRGLKTVTLHHIQNSYFGRPIWTTGISRPLRPFDSLILDDNTKAELLDELRAFMSSESWYHDNGVPYRCSYLLHGPSGTGKTATVYTLAGELNLKVYTLSLSDPMMNDVSLNRLLARVPGDAILLLEDIDCVSAGAQGPTTLTRNGVPLPDAQEQMITVSVSGVLSLLDGIGSDDGRIIFATTNHLAQVHPALLHAGRLTRTIPYALASCAQASALFDYIFSGGSLAAGAGSPAASDGSSAVGRGSEAHGALRARFAAGVTEGAVSMSDLEGYLVRHRRDCEGAVAGVKAWAESVVEQRRALERLRLADGMRASSRVP